MRGWHSPSDAIDQRPAEHQAMPWRPPTRNRAEVVKRLSEERTRGSARMRQPLLLADRFYTRFTKRYRDLHDQAD